MHMLANMLALFAAAAQSPVVQVATGDWSGLPRLEVVGYDHLSSTIMTKLYEIGREQKCRLPGFRGNRMDMSISFAVQFSPDGRLNRLLIPQLNCPEAEAWLGGTLLRSVANGDFRPDPRDLNVEGWYRGDFNFSYEG